MSTIKSVLEIEKILLQIIQEKKQYESLIQELEKRISLIEELIENESGTGYTDNYISNIKLILNEENEITPNTLTSINDLYKNLSIYFNEKAALFKRFSDEFSLIEPVKLNGCLLIADDSKTAVKILKDLLIKKGIDENKILTTYDGFDTVSILKERTDIELIFLDWMMPVMSGIEVLEWKSESENYKSVPVIMMSAVNDVDQIKDAIKHGITDYIVKPYNQDILWAKVRKILSDNFNNAKLEFIDDIDKLFLDMDVKKPEKPILIVSEDNNFWKSYIQKKELKSFSYVISNRIKEAKLKLKEAHFSCLIIEAHFGIDEINKFLEKIYDLTFEQRLPIILYFENELQIKDLKDEDHILLEKNGIIDFQVKHNDFRRLYEKLGNVYVAWNCPFEKLGKLVYVNPFLNQFVQKAESFRNQRDKYSDPNLAGIFKFEDGIKIDLLQSYDFEKGNIKYNTLEGVLKSESQLKKININFKKFKEIDTESKVLSSLNFIDNINKEQFEELIIDCPKMFHDSISNKYNQSENLTLTDSSA